MHRLFTVALVLNVLGGCGGPGGPPRGAIEGTVTLDGAAIEKGSITFLPTGGTQGPATGAAVADGRYRLSAADGPVVGRNRVEIRAPRRTGRKTPVWDTQPDNLIDESIEIMPARYNSESTLEAEVKPGKNTVNFELTTQ